MKTNRKLYVSAQLAIVVCLALTVARPLLCAGDFLELDDLLRIGGYRDYSEVIALAVSNQLLRQRGVKARRGASTA